MLVVEAERFGGPQVLTARQAPDPVAGPGRRKLAVVRHVGADEVVDYSEPEVFRQRAAPRRATDPTKPHPSAHHTRIC